MKNLTKKYKIYMKKTKKLCKDTKESLKIVVSHF